MVSGEEKVRKNKKDAKNPSRNSNSRITKEVLLDITDGVLSTITEIILAELFLGLSLLVSGSYSGSVYRASKMADDILEDIKTGTVKRTCHQLKSQGYITYVKGKNAAASARLTKEGLERVGGVLPRYKEKRSWDGKLYLITYDIPENRRRDRDSLRYFLKKFGCGQLQQSVWVTPYNPRGVLEEIVKENRIVGDIIISDTGKEGNIGRTNFKELMGRVYDLRKINDRYAEYIEIYQLGKFKAREQAIFKFLSIVGDDPQLPHELLPEDWLGDKAYSLFRNFM